MKTSQVITQSGTKIYLCQEYVDRTLAMAGPAMKLELDIDDALETELEVEVGSFKAFHELLVTVSLALFERRESKKPSTSYTQEVETYFEVILLEATHAYCEVNGKPATH